MGLFRKKKIVEVDDRTSIERKFEDAGQVAGKKTGEFVQQSVDTFEKVKTKIKADEKIEKVKEMAAKAEDKIDEIVVKATKASKDTYQKAKKKVGK